MAEGVLRLVGSIIIAEYEFKAGLSKESVLGVGA
jgi:hypothetical protein